MFSDEINNSKIHENYLKWFALALFFSILSSCRIYYLPELQIVLIILFGPWFSGRIKFNYAALLLCVFCTHFYAIPDAAYRFNSGEYPSIYTKSIDSVKYLDILVIVLAISSLYNIKKFNSIFIRTKYPFYLPMFFLLGWKINPSGLYNSTSLLFICRSILLMVAIALLFSQFSYRQIIELCTIAVFSWATKMLFAVLIPAENPLYREILGFKLNIPFAGDEYLTLGVYASIACAAFKTTSSKYIKYLLFAAFVLCIVAQRKGALQYFGLLALVIAWGGVSGLRNKIVNLVILILPWSLSVFLLLVVPFLPVLLSLAFYEYSQLISSAIESVLHLFKDNFLASIFGIGPTGLYEIYGLDPLLDNEFGFVGEVGEKYRYAIWSIPYGRLILNVGVFGFLIHLIYLLINMRQSAFIFYLYSTICGVFCFANTTPVEAIAYGIAFAALPKIILVQAREKMSRKQALVSPV